MNKITIDGVDYELVPITKKEEVEADLFTLSRSCESDCGTFTFSQLLEEDGNVWEDTESITYKKGKDTEDYWDNEAVLRDYFNNDLRAIITLEEGLTRKEIKLLKQLRNRVNALGWMNYKKQ